MGKLFVFLLVLCAIYLVRRALVRPPASPRKESGARPTPPPIERMVECAHCGLHVPESEAVAAEGRSFCCEAHRQAHQQRTRAGG